MMRLPFLICAQNNVCSKSNACWECGALHAGLRANTWISERGKQCLHDFCWAGTLAVIARAGFSSARELPTAKVIN
jgi:hypothetical protein